MLVIVPVLAPVTVVAFFALWIECRARIAERGQHEKDLTATAEVWQKKVADLDALYKQEMADAQPSFERYLQEKDGRIEAAEKKAEDLVLKLAAVVGANEALKEHYRVFTERLATIEGQHVWHIGGAGLSHNNDKHVLYTCTCGTKVLAPEGFFRVASNGHIPTSTRTGDLHTAEGRL